MKRNMKRCLAGVMALVLALSLLPASVLAADKATPISALAWEEAGYKTPDAVTGEGWSYASGYTMANCDLVYARYVRTTWNEATEQEETEIAIVIARDTTAGAGDNYAIPDYGSGAAPWAITTGIGSVYIEDGITAIGDNAFSGILTLETVEIPSSVTAIGDNAFSGDRSLRASTDGSAMDLSNVTSFGAGAFNECVLLGSTGGVTLNTEGGLTEIPDRAFANTGLREIQLNDHITAIGDYAFYGCSLSGMATIDLPEALMTIGDYAFGRNTDAPQITITSLTIPSKVVTIGKYAFYNFTSLATVTVESTVLQKPGEAAFGDSENNAYAVPGELEIGDQVVQGMLGTVFLPPDGVVYDEENPIFEDGVNCFLGDRSPMELIAEIPAKCEQTGLKTYQFTFNGQPGGIYTQTTPVLGHDLTDWTYVDATCLRGAYWWQGCKREGCDYYDTKEDYDNLRLAHQYVAKVTPDDTIDGTGTTTVTYTCQLDCHPEGDPTKHYTFTIPAASLSATTSDSLADLADQLAAIQVEGGMTASIQWSEKKIGDIEALLTYKEGSQTFPVTLHTTVSDNTLPDYGDDEGEDLFITVQVKKTVLDLSGAGVNTDVAYVSGKNPTISPVGFDTAGIETSQVQFSESTDGPWNSNQPENIVANVDKDFYVRVYFTYDDEKYRLPKSEDTGLYPGQDYTLVDEGNGSAYLYCRYQVLQNVMAVDVSAIAGLVYDGRDKDTVRVSGVPETATVIFYRRDSAGTGWEEVERKRDPKNGVITGFSQANAGSWEVRVVVDNGEEFEQVDRIVNAAIAEAPVAVPRVQPTTQYTPGLNQTGVTGINGSETSPYTLEEGSVSSAEDAGTYQVVLTLKEPENYQWSNLHNSAQVTGESGETVTISWSIPKRMVQKPGLNQTVYQYDPAYPLRQPVTNPSTGHDDGTGTKVQDIAYAYSGSTLIATYTPYYNNQWHEEDKEEIFRITEASATGAGTYHPEATLTYPKNYAWVGESEEKESYSLGEWEIRKATIQAPQISAQGKTYDGKPYDPTNRITFISGGENVGTGKPLQVTGYTYYPAAGENPLSLTPTAAGSYRIMPVYDVNSNYTLTNDYVEWKAAAFTIEKAPLELAAPEDYTLSYTGSAQQIEPVEIDGTFYGSDSPEDCTVKYAVSTDGGTEYGQSTAEIPALTERGVYTIRATLEADNYTATPVTYTVTIGMGQQSITLDSEDPGWNEMTKTMTVTVGEHASFTVTGTPAIGSPAVTYTVSDERDSTGAEATGQILRSDGNGTMTILGAGSATVTVSVGKSANAGPAEASYSVTINRGEAEIVPGETSFGYTGEARVENDYAAAVKPAKQLENPDFKPQPSVEGEAALQYRFYDQDPAQGEEVQAIPQPTAVGEYYLEITYPGDKNYLGTTKVVEFTITDADMTVEAKEALTETYAGTEFALSEAILAVKDKDELVEGYQVEFVKADEEPTDWESAQTVETFQDVDDSGTYWYRVTAENYAPDTGRFTVTVNPKTVTLGHNIEKLSKVYDGGTGINSANGEVTLTLTDTGGTVTAGSVSAAYNSKNVEEAKEIRITATLSPVGEEKLNNYVFQFNGAAVTVGEGGAVTLTISGEDVEITPMPITVTDVTATDREYNGEKTVTLDASAASSTGVLGKDKDTVTFTVSGSGRMENADAEGNKTVAIDPNAITPGGQDGKNYAVQAVDSTTVTIRHKAVTLTPPDDLDAAFTTHPLDTHYYYVKASGLLGTDGVTFIPGTDIAYTFYQAGETKPLEGVPSAVGTYNVSATLAESAGGKYKNYAVGQVQFTVEITSVGNVSVIPKDYTGTYNGGDHLQKILASWDFGGYLNKWTVTFLLKEEGKPPHPDDDAEWAEKDFINVSDSGDYWFRVTAPSHQPFYGETTINIQPAEITITPALNLEKVYDGTDDYVDSAPTATVDTGVDGESISAAYVADSAAYSTTDAGKNGTTVSAKFTLTAGTDTVLGNYTFDGTTALTDSAQITVTVDGTITPRAVTVNIKDQQKEYDGSAPALPGTNLWELTYGSLVNQDDLGITLAIQNSGSANAGAYAITGGWSNTNYSVTFTGSWSDSEAGTYTIRQKAITIQIGSTAGHYGNAPDVDDVELTLASGSTMVGSDTPETIRKDITFQVEDKDGNVVTEKTGVGDYTITGSVEGGNYAITFLNGKYEVLQRPITIALKNQSSAYGCEVNVKQDAYDSYDNGGDAGIVNGDDLGIRLTTRATEESDAGRYDITSETTKPAAGNYAITWSGGGTGGTCGLYTIEKAQIGAAFELGDQQSFPIAYQQTYTNALLVTNASNSGSAISDLAGAGIAVAYSSSDEKIATVNSDGVVTLLGTGTVKITAKVTTSGSTNYTGSVETWYTLQIAQDSGGTGIYVQAAGPLTYDGTAQTLAQVVNPNQIPATFQYTVTNAAGTTIYEGSDLPTATDAGEYTVTWTATPTTGAFAETNGNFKITIQKAVLKDIFLRDSVTVAYTEGGTYSENLNSALEQEFGGTVVYSSTLENIASFESSSNYELTIHDYGVTIVQARLTGSRNYQDTFFSYTLEVTSAENIIQYTADGYTGDYDGRPHTVTVTVDQPTSGVVVYYKPTENSASYSTQTPPSYTDAGTYTVYFCIEAPGCSPEYGTETVTIHRREITADMIQGVEPSYPYNGASIAPAVSVEFTDGAYREVLIPNVDYTVSYGANTSGMGTVTVDASNSKNFTGTVQRKFTITQRDAQYLSASLDHTFGFVGVDEPNTATPAVTFNGQALVYGIDYTVACSGGVTPGGNGTMTFTAPGPYTITVTPTGPNFGGDAITLTYYLLTAEDGLLLKEGGVTTATYGEAINGAITVKDELGNTVPESEYTLTYTYYPNGGGTPVTGKYTPDKMVNADAGLYVVTATGKPYSSDPANLVTGAYEDLQSVYVFLIQPRDLKDATVTANDAPYDNGQPVTPQVTVTYRGETVSDRNYTLAYYNNTQLGQGYVWVSAQGGNYVGAALQTFDITAPRPQNLTLTVGKTYWVYNGTPQAGSMVVTSPGKTLAIGTDYTLTVTKDGQEVYTGADTDDAIASIVAVGSYTVTATGTGDYTGLTSSVPVTVAPDPQAPTLTVTADKTALYGGGTVTLTVVVSNPAALAKAELAVAQNGMPYATLPLTDRGGGRYTTTFTAPNVSATYTFTATHMALTDSATVSVTASGGSQGGGDHGGVHYIIEAEAGAGGSISPSGRVSVSPGSDRTFRISADEDYVIDDVLVDGESVGAVSQYTFENVRKNHTITVLFRLAQGTGIADPSVTGVADWLNTVDHDAFLSGYSGGTFQPNAPMTRAEAAQMFYNLLLDKNVPSGDSYRDVSSGDWYAEAVRVMSALGIITGYEDGTFRPQASITRGEFAALAMRFARTVDGAPVTFTDVSSGDWYYRYVTGAAAYGWITGYEDGSFRPMNSITRAEVATIANRMLGRIPDESYINSHLLQIQQFTDLGLPHWAFYQIMEAANGHNYRKNGRAENWTALR